MGQVPKYEGYHLAERLHDTRRLEGVGVYIIMALEKDPLQLESMHKPREVLLEAVDMRP